MHRKTGPPSLIFTSIWIAWVGLGMGSLMFGMGCRTPVATTMLPTRELMERDYLVFHSNFVIPRRHRLLDDLVWRRYDLEQILQFPLSDEPVHIYLFDQPEAFHAMLEKSQPNLADRRAVFEETDTELRVFAVWGDRVAEDLRHEVTHGYLHAAIPNIPLWMDEGLAEYFETPRGEDEVNSPHVYQLSKAFSSGAWTPNLHRLEQLRKPEDLKQIDYAEAWLWMHYLLKDSPPSSRVVSGAIHELRATGSCRPISEVLREKLPEADVGVADHLHKLAKISQDRVKSDSLD